MNIDNEYSKSFFDVWFEGLREATMLEDAGICCNNGHSEYHDRKVKS